MCFISYAWEFDRYHHPALSIAVLTDEDPDWRPSLYQHQVFKGAKLQFEFAVIKLLDYATEVSALQTQSNPFGIIIWAHLESQKTRQKSDQRLKIKLLITRALYEHGYNLDAKTLAEIFGEIAKSSE